MTNSLTSPTLTPATPPPTAGSTSATNQVPPPQLQPTSLLDTLEQEIEHAEHRREAQISNTSRLIAATTGAVLTSLVVTPFDVIKTRLQAQYNPISKQNATTPASATASASQSPASRPSQTRSAGLRRPMPRPVPSSATAVMQSWCDVCQVFMPYTHSFNHLTPIGAGPLCDVTVPKQPRNRFYPSLHTQCVLQPTVTVAHHAPHVPATALPATAAATSIAAAEHFNGSVDAVRKLVRNEGVSSLWRGLSATLLMSVPSTVVYYSLYDQMKLTYSERLSDSQWSSFVPLLSGTTARTITTVLVSPVELIRTRAQATKQKLRMADIVRGELQKGGVAALWRGATPTLWRDVPFSAVYWSCYEAIKTRLFTHWKAQSRLAASHHYADYTDCTHLHRSNHHDDHHTLPVQSIDDARAHVLSTYRERVIYSAFISGATSGIIAATVTHPFDLIKTRRQIEMYSSRNAAGASALQSSSTWSLMKTVVAEEGWRGLTAGLVPRLIKITPACSVMISAYEVTKTCLTPSC